MPHAIALDLTGCCLTRNYWSQTLIPFWCQNISNYLYEQDQSPKLGPALKHYLRATGLDDRHPVDAQSHEIDRGIYAAHMVQTLEAERWPAGLPTLISELTNVGLDSGLLQPQIYADAISSLKRWHTFQWPIVLFSPLAPGTQQRLMARCQAPELKHLVQRYEPMGLEPYGCNDQTLETQLNTLRQEHPQHPVIWITTDIDRLEAGRRVGCHCFLLDREFAYHESLEHRQHQVILDLSLVDLILPDSLPGST